LDNFKSSFFKIKNMKDYLYSLVRMILICGLCFIILYPLLIRIATSFMGYEDLLDPSVRWIPRNFTLQNYTIAYEGIYYIENLISSLTLALTVSILSLFSCIIVGYGFARFEFRGRSIWFALVIFTFIVPPQIILVPNYLNFRFFNLFGLLGEEGFNLIGTYWPFILPAATASGLRNGLFVFIARQFFIGMPDSLEEAAYVDGAGPLKTFRTVMLPSAGPIIVIIFLFSFVWQYNDYIMTSLLTGRSGFLPFALQSLRGTVSTLYEAPIEDWVSEPEFASALENTGIILFLAPIIFIYLILQRYFIESIQRTGIVG